jgi:NAD(P)-dependent dehydrogenase (short-subunit alcohol dehydrogenase family)
MANVGYPMGTEEDLEITQKEVERVGRRIVGRKADVRDRAAVAAVVEEGLDAFGRLDIVVANAGIMPIYGDLSRTTGAWDDCLDVMLTGVMNTVESAYPRIVEQGEGGSIVMTGSMAGVQPMIRTEGTHTLGMLAYSSAKGALDILMRNYASLLASSSIRVNLIHPTGVNTLMANNDLIHSHWRNAHPDDMQTLINALPVPTVQPIDISNAIVWLCSEEARYVTGSAIRVDAGASLR